MQIDHSFCRQNDTSDTAGLKQSIFHCDSMSNVEGFLLSSMTLLAHDLKCGPWRLNVSDGMMDLQFQP